MARVDSPGETLFVVVKSFVVVAPRAASALASPRQRNSISWITHRSRSGISLVVFTRLRYPLGGLAAPQLDE